MRLNPCLYNYLGPLGRRDALQRVAETPYWITVIITIAVTAFVYLNVKKDEQHRKEMEKTRQQPALKNEEA